MKCWRCGKNNDKGVANCAFCGIAAIRYKAETEIGKAMRNLYDQLGCNQIFSNKKLLLNGIQNANVSGYTEALKNNLSKAFDAGIGKLYLAQVEKGIPDNAFYTEVKTLLKGAGFSRDSGMEIIWYFDEMIGWRQIRRHTPDAAGVSSTPASSSPAANTSTPVSSIPLKHEQRLPSTATTSDPWWKKYKKLLIAAGAAIIVLAILCVILFSGGKTKMGYCENCGQYERLHPYVMQGNFFNAGNRGEVEYLCDTCLRLAKTLGE